jgi:putative Mg2+ transporter-C (MgtC) family protein
LGAAIGLERQWRQRLAGLRTNTLVALGAATFILFSRLTSDADGAARVGAQVVSGIGFLGAGVIFKEGLNVRGLNTAATLWCSAAVGLLAGMGFILYGLLCAALVVASNLILRPLVQAINRQPVDGSEVERTYVASVVCRGADAPPGARDSHGRTYDHPGHRFHRTGDQQYRGQGSRRSDGDRNFSQATGNRP